MLAELLGEMQVQAGVRVAWNYCVVYTDYRRTDRQSHLRSVPQFQEPSQPHEGCSEKSGRVAQLAEQLTLNQ